MRCVGVHELKGRLKKKVKTPIIDAVYSILYESQPPKKVFAKLTDKLD